MDITQVETIYKQYTEISERVSAVGEKYFSSYWSVDNWDIANGKVSAVYSQSHSCGDVDYEGLEFPVAWLADDFDLEKAIADKKEQERQAEIKRKEEEKRKQAELLEQLSRTAKEKKYKTYLKLKEEFEGDDANS